MAKPRSMLSPWRQFQCLYEKNIENYLKSRQTIYFNTNEGTSQCPMYPSIGLGSDQVDNPNFKCEERTPEE